MRAAGLHPESIYLKNSKKYGEKLGVKWKGSQNHSGWRKRLQKDKSCDGSKGLGKIRLGVIHLTFLPTFTRWGRVAPLAVGLTLSTCGPLHLITPITNKADHIVEVEAISHCATIYWTSWMAAADGCRGDSGNHWYMWLQTETDNVLPTIHACRLRGVTGCHSQSLIALKSVMPHVICSSCRWLVPSMYVFDQC